MWNTINLIKNRQFFYFANFLRIFINDGKQSKVVFLLDLFFSERHEHESMEILVKKRTNFLWPCDLNQLWKCEDFFSFLASLIFIWDFWIDLWNYGWNIWSCEIVVKFTITENLHRLPPVYKCTKKIVFQPL